jgi:hypothetical protein
MGEEHGNSARPGRRWPHRQKRFECVNCGYEGSAPITGAGPLLWILLLATAWNAWLFHHAGMELEALGACVFALLGAWVSLKLPRWIRCPACRWRHPVGRDE